MRGIRRIAIVHRYSFNKYRSLNFTKLGCINTQDCITNAKCSSPPKDYEAGKAPTQERALWEFTLRRVQYIESVFKQRARMINEAPNTMCTPEAVLLIVRTTTSDAIRTTSLSLFVRPKAATDALEIDQRGPTFLGSSSVWWSTKLPPKNFWLCETTPPEIDVDKCAYWLLD